MNPASGLPPPPPPRKRKQMAYQHPSNSMIPLVTPNSLLPLSVPPTTSSASVPQANLPPSSSSSAFDLTTPAFDPTREIIVQPPDLSILSSVSLPSSFVVPPVPASLSSDPSSSPHIPHSSIGTPSVVPLHNPPAVIRSMPPPVPPKPKPTSPVSSTTVLSDQQGRKNKYFQAIDAFNAEWGTSLHRMLQQCYAKRDEAKMKLVKATTVQSREALSEGLKRYEKLIRGFTFFINYLDKSDPVHEKNRFDLVAHNSLLSQFKKFLITTGASENEPRGRNGGQRKAEPTKSTKSIVANYTEALRHQQEQQRRQEAEQQNRKRQKQSQAAATGNSLLASSDAGVSSNLTTAMIGAAPILADVSKHMISGTAAVAVARAAGNVRASAPGLAAEASPLHQAQQGNSSAHPLSELRRLDAVVSSLTPSGSKLKTAGSRQLVVNRLPSDPVSMLVHGGTAGDDEPSSTSSSSDLLSQLKQLRHSALDPWTSNLVWGDKVTAAVVSEHAADKKENATSPPTPPVSYPVPFCTGSLSVAEPNQKAGASSFRHPLPGGSLSLELEDLSTPDQHGCAFTFQLDRECIAPSLRLSCTLLGPGASWLPSFSVDVPPNYPPARVGLPLRFCFPLAYFSTELCPDLVQLRVNFERFMITLPPRSSLTQKLLVFKKAFFYLVKVNSAFL